MKTDEKTTLNEYRMGSSAGKDSRNKDNVHNDAPWDNNWLSSVTNG